MSLIFGTPEANALAAPAELPCPFCGNESTRISERRDYFGDALLCIRCNQCGAKGPEARTKNDAVRAWNTRE